MAEKMSAESVQATEDQDKTGQRLAAQKLKYARKLVKLLFWWNVQSKHYPGMHLCFRNLFINFSANGLE